MDFTTRNMSMRTNISILSLIRHAISNRSKFQNISKFQTAIRIPFIAKITPMLINSPISLGSPNPSDEHLALVAAAKSPASPSPPRKVIDASPPKPLSMPSLPGKHIIACIACGITRADYKRKYEDWKESLGFQRDEFNYLHSWKKHNSNKKPDSKCVYGWEDNDEYTEPEKKKKKQYPRKKKEGDKPRPPKLHKSPDVCPGECGVSRGDYVEAYITYHKAINVTIAAVSAGVSWANHCRSAANGRVCPKDTFGTQIKAARASQTPAVAVSPSLLLAAAAAAAVPAPVVIPAKAEKKQEDKKETGVSALTRATQTFLEHMAAHCKLLRDGMTASASKTAELTDDMKMCEANMVDENKRHEVAITGLKRKHEALGQAIEESKAKRQEAEKVLEQVEGNLTNFGDNVAALTKLTKLTTT